MTTTSRLLTFAALLLIHQAAANPAIEPMVGFEMGPNPNGATAPMRAPLYLRGDGYFYGTSPAGGAFNKGTLMKMSKTGWFDSLSFSSGSLGQPGDVPMSSLVPSSDGWLWGTTSGGGVLSVYGTIFRVKPETGEFQTMHNFASGLEGNSPSCGLVSDGQGNFWGVTRYTNNGTSTNGIIFRINELTGVFTRVYSFPGTSTYPNGRVPQGGLYHDGAGNLWGTTSLGGTYGYGTVFKYNISAGTLTNVVHFSDRTVQAGAIKGSGAASALIPDGNGFLWGVTPYGGSSIGDGTVFKVEMATNTATSVLEFSNNGSTNKGQYPQGPLVSDGAGNLWGVANTGATSNEGSVFKISTATGVLTTVLQFGSLTGANATVNNPWNGLTNDGEGNLWGIATAGGAASSWAAYKIRISDGAFTKVVEQVPGGVSYKGRYPLAGLAGNATSPWLWGTTSEGGSSNLGTLFRYNPATGEHNTVISFTGITGTALGSKPNGKLFVDASGVVWGTTETGGAFGSPTGYGTIFKYDPTPGTFTTVQSFSGNGIRPKGALVGMSDGLIWGTTSSGLSGNLGTVFKINPGTNAVTTVYSFTSASSTTNGSEPVCGLAEDASGFVWGTTQRGGANSNSGMLFKIEIATGTFTPVRSFATNANLQTGNLVVDASGSIYGSNATRVFKYVPGTSTYTDIFINEDINVPLKGVTLGTLYKTAAGDIRFLGTEGTRDLAAPNNFYTSLRAVIYQINTGTNAVTKLRVLAEGIVGPQTPADLPTVGGLYEHTDGSFYGITSANGTDEELKPAGGGMIYRVSTGPVAMTQPYNSPSTTAFYTLVSGTTATLRGYANPNGNATTCEFEWGPTTELGNIVPANAPVGTGYTGGMCEAVLTGLPANTTYFFRLRANSTGEPSYGPIRSIQTGTAVPATTPEISVESPIGQSLTDNVTTVNLGSLLVGQSIKQAVVARNLGSGAVGTYELTGITATVTGPNAGDFVITTPFDATQLPFNNLLSTGLLITFTPSGAGERTATLTITSNDANESSFEIPLSGTGLIQPEIEVDTPTPITLQSDEGTDDFGNSAVNAGTDRVFTIRNTGNAPLTNLIVTAAGIHASNFTITSQPPASIAAGASATFTATFTPSIAGLRTGSLLIASNDDEDPFIINVSGTGIIAPEIQVLDDTVNLIDGASSINFGSLGINGSSTRVITIRNVGSSNLTGISLSFSGGDIGDFLFGPVAASVSAGQQITFNLTFYPLSTGAKATTLRIASNDSNENPFDIALTGTSGIPTDPLAEFLTNAGVPEGLRGPNDDADFDGFDNLLEYALDLNPNGSGGAFTGTPPVLGSTPTLLQLTYRRVRNDVTYVVQTTTDLTNGPWTTGGVNQGSPAGDGTTTASIPLAAGSAFLRLVVTKIP